MKGLILPTLNLRHYKNQKEPYVAKIVKDSETSTKFEFLPKTASRRSSDKTYGMYQVTVDKEGFYIIGNAQDDENGHRLYFSTPSGNKFPFIRGQDTIKDIKARILRGELISQIAAALEL